LRDYSVASLAMYARAICCAAAVTLRRLSASRPRTSKVCHVPAPGACLQDECGGRYAPQAIIELELNRSFV
jgi:hypothetical protein